jgi:hypothetical protein
VSIRGPELGSIRPGGQRGNSENFARARRLMSDRMEFEIVCPNDHNQTVTFSREEFEEALKSGAVGVPL